jgi:hypothetical protein
MPTPPAGDAHCLYSRHRVKQPDSVMSADGSVALLLRVEQPHCVGLRHEITHLILRQPTNPHTLVTRAKFPRHVTRQEDERHNVACHVLVDARQSDGFNHQTGLFFDFPYGARTRFLSRLEYSARQFPVAIVPALDGQEPAVFTHDRCGDAH